MTSEELLADLRERLDNGALDLAEMEARYRASTVRQVVEHSRRLRGKREGLLLVKDWLRAYDEPSTT